MTMTMMMKVGHHEILMSTRVKLLRVNIDLTHTKIKKNYTVLTKVAKCPLYTAITVMSAHQYQQIANTLNWRTD